ncbi:hypothetical protein ABLB84_14655 [Xenorhabdus szentirmaii]|uniref:hypothetical protein n=1 Tax=Xenorhabdus szentirmaii TaxID=290112 RepID=UPI0032B77799
MNWFKRLKISKYAIPAKPFVDRKIELLKIPFAKYDQEALKGFIPLTGIDDDVCSIQRAGQSLHYEFLCFSLVILSLIFGLFYYTAFEEQQLNHYKKIKAQVTLTKKKYGEHYYLLPTLPENMALARYVDDEKTRSFWTELHYRYSYSEHKLTYQILDILMFLLLLICFSLPFYLYYFHPLPPPLFIDRKRQIIFTWHKGNVFVSRYSQVNMFQYDYKIAETKLITALGLYTQDKNQKLLQYLFRPNVLISLNETDIRKKALAPYIFMVQYLCNGKEAIAESCYGLIKPSRFWREERKPGDFDKQMARILAALDAGETAPSPSLATKSSSLSAYLSHTYLIDAEKALLEMPMKPKNRRELKAFAPLKSINDRYCVLRSRRPVLRFSLLFLALLLCILVFNHNVENYNRTKGWEKPEILKDVQSVRIEYGDNFHLRDDLSPSLDGLKFINGLGLNVDDPLPDWAYLYYRLHYHYLGENTYTVSDYAEKFGMFLFFYSFYSLFWFLLARTFNSH